MGELEAAMVVEKLLAGNDVGAATMLEEGNEVSMVEEGNEVSTVEEVGTAVTALDF